MADDLSEQVASVAALADPTRLALYRCVANADGPVSREQASAAVRLPLHTVKFHLDRLVDEGLLSVEFRRLTGRTGPGAGRPAKLYRCADRQITVALPERHYDLVGDVLAAAIARAGREQVPVLQAVRDAARGVGRRIALEAGRGSTAAVTPTDEADWTAFDSDAGRIAKALANYGYRPRLVDRDLCLTNCPFDRLATEHTDLVCGMNVDLVAGVVEGTGVRKWQARLDPQAGWCCVRVSRSV